MKTTLLFALVLVAVHGLPNTRRDAMTEGLGAVEVSLVAEWAVKDAAVTHLLPTYLKTPALGITTFGVLGSEPLFVIPDIKQGNKSSPVSLMSNIDWCNMVVEVDKADFGADNVLLVAGGFLVPGHTTGNIQLVVVDAQGEGTAYKISPDKKNYFYHHAVVYDVDGDGKKDVLAARATSPSLPWKPKAGELVWFKQPDNGPFVNQEWEEHILFQGPDVGFVLLDIDDDGFEELFASEFFSSQNLVMYWCDKGMKWANCTQDSVQSLTIDSSGPYFAVEVADLNNDKQNDLLVTRNKDDGTGAVLGYELPKDLKTSKKAVKHVLSQGYKPPASITPGKGGPGRATSFLVPNIHKPVIAVSGDDAGTLSLLVSSEREGWDYSEMFIVNATGTMGTVAVGDVDGDGTTELFAPHYSEGLLQMFSVRNA